MKVKSLKQVLHGVFLLVGIVSIIALAISLSTYLDYARGGYGLEASISNARLDGGNLLMDVRIGNPGGLGMEILGGNVTLGSRYPLIYLSDDASEYNGTVFVAEVYPIDAGKEIAAGDEITFHISVLLTEDDMALIRGSGRAEIALRLRIFVPDRDVRTPLLHEVSMEVSL